MRLCFVGGVEWCYSGFVRIPNPSPYHVIGLVFGSRESNEVFLRELVECICGGCESCSQY